jgi:uncharacterized membrane protein
LKKEDAGENRKPDFENLISAVLRYGVLLSVALIALGAIIISIDSLLPGTPIPNSIETVIVSGYGRPSDFDVLSNLAKGNPLSIIELGTIILLATPVIRVGMSVLLFAYEKDRLFVALTGFVLAVLLFSIFVLGPIEAALG